MLRIQVSKGINHARRLKAQAIAAHGDAGKGVPTVRAGALALDDLAVLPQQLHGKARQSLPLVRCQKAVRVIVQEGEARHLAILPAGFRLKAFPAGGGKALLRC